MRNQGTCGCPAPITDGGPRPMAVNIERLTRENPYYRTTLWTGSYLQATLMSIPVGGDIGLENHADTDQFLRIESGCGVVAMGNERHSLPYRRRVGSADAIFVPAGTWHNVTNIGTVPLKLYSIYAPPHHPQGTLHPTKADAEAAEG